MTFKLKNALLEEFSYWIENQEFTEEMFDKIDKLSVKDKVKIVDFVINDEEFTQELYKCFNYYLYIYLKVKDHEQ